MPQACRPPLFELPLVPDDVAEGALGERLDAVERLEVEARMCAGGPCEMHFLRARRDELQAVAQASDREPAGDFLRPAVRVRLREVLNMRYSTLLLFSLAVSCSGASSPGPDGTGEEGDGAVDHEVADDGLLPDDAVESAEETDADERDEPGEGPDDAAETLDVACPAGDACGPGEYIDPVSGICVGNCRNACANGCAPGVCGCADLPPFCGPATGCPCGSDPDCRFLDPDGDLCNGCYICNGPFGCGVSGPVSCDPGTTCNPLTGACDPA